MTSDRLVVSVDVLPVSRKEALTLAWQQVAYCEDLVMQGADTVGNLATFLQRAREWQFWWD